MKLIYLLPLIVYLLLPQVALVSAADESIVSKESSMIVSGIRIIIRNSPNKEDYYIDMAKRIIPIKSGDPLDKISIQTGINALKLSNRFKSIHVDSVTTPNGEVVVFTLTPYRYVRDIRIHGAYPLFERDVLNQMTIYPGDPFTTEDFSEHTRAIEKRYRREGYIDPQVKIAFQPDVDDETVVIEVNISTGPHYSLGTLTFNGNHGISFSALCLHMQVWRTAMVPGIGRFSEYRLKKDLEALLKYYRQKGFADAKLSYHIDNIRESHHVDVTVTIREGHRYEIAIDGNKEFWNLTLKKDIVLSTIGNRSNIGVRKSIRNMTNRYRAAGYLHTRIDPQMENIKVESLDIRKLRFIIHEGPQTIVDAVTLTGNRTLPEKEIREQLLTRPPTTFNNGTLVSETLEEDVYAVTTLYMNQGFRERKVESQILYNEDQSRADITLKIDEGPQTRVRSISFTGLTVLPEATIRPVLVHSKGSPFRNTAIETEKQAIISMMAEKGYVHTVVETDVSYNAEKTLADIIYEVRPGPQVTLGEVFIAGNLRTKEKVIRQELKVQPETPLSLQTLHEGQRQLRNLAIFHGVRYRTTGLQEQKEVVNLFVDVEENKPFYVQFGGGYESDSGLFGRVMAGDRNVFGLNKDLWASGEVSQTGYRMETRVTEPRFLNTRTTASIGFFNEELIEFNQPFGTRTTGGSLGFGRELGKHLTTTLSFSLEKRDQFRVEDDHDSRIEEGTRTIFVTTPFIRYDSRDSFVRPTKGWFTSLSVDISKGVEEQVDDFVRYLFDTRYFLTPFDKLTLAGLVRIGQVVPYSGSEQVPDDQLFFLGGVRDVRGFKENLLRYDGDGNPVGGRTAIVGSLEVRIDMGMNLELTTFFDIGSVQDAMVEEGTEEFRPTAGLGLRYITPIGPMGFLYGHKLDRREGEAADRFHLSIGYSF